MLDADQCRRRLGQADHRRPQPDRRRRQGSDRRRQRQQGDHSRRSISPRRRTCRSSRSTSARTAEASMRSCAPTISAWAGSPARRWPRRSAIRARCCRCRARRPRSTAASGAQGFHDCITQKHPNIELIERPTDWDATKQAAALQTVLAANPDLKGVFQQSDYALSPTLNVLEAGGPRRQGRRSRTTSTTSASTRARRRSS